MVLDIDTDVHPKEKVIEYLKEKYGKMSVCQICNFSYITPTVAIKDVARVLDNDPARLERFGKKIGAKKAMDLAKLFAHEKWEDCLTANKEAIEKYKNDEMFADVIRIAEKLSGRVRHISTHAGGVGIVDTEITDYMPMLLTSKNEQVIQVDKKIVEQIGIVKFDLLGLNTLSILKGALDITGIDHWEIDPNNEEFLSDKETYELIGSGDTTNVFQLESQGMRDLCKKIKPNNIRDVSLILALYRPDTMSMLDDYVKRRTGEQEITYLHPDMIPILEETLGIQAYQEQTLQIVRTFGGRSYGRSDIFRRLIAKKIADQVKAETEVLRQEIIDNGYDVETSDMICDLLKNKGGLTNKFSPIYQQW